MSENKKNISIIIVFIFLLCVGCSSKVKDNGKEISDVTIIDSIISYNDEFDRGFLEFVDKEYGIKSLTKIEESLANGSYSDSLWHDITGNSYIVLNDLYNDRYRNMDNVRVLNTKDGVNLSFVGDISLADNFEIMPYYDSRGKGIYGILSTDVVDRMKKADIMVANNEFAVTTSDNKIDKLYNFKADPSRLNIYKEMGIDLVSLANNHVYDYGEEGLLDTIKYLDEYDIPNVGAGENISDAKEAYYYVASGYKISFISASRAEKYVVTPNAMDDTPGVFWCYNPELLIETIKKEKEISDFVIVLIHWGREDSHLLENVQVETGKLYIDAGADLIIGAHAHVLQGFEIYNDKLIAYNLGDFIFNRETKDTGILSVNINNDGNMSYEFIPCRQSDFKTSMLYDDERLRVINDIQSYSSGAIITDNGNIHS